MNKWAEESLRQAQKEGLKTVKVWHLEEYWKEEKTLLNEMKGAKCRFCGEPLKLEDVCDRCFGDKMTKIHSGYDEILRNVSNQIEQRLFLKMTSAFTNMRRQEMRVPKLKSPTEL